MIKIYVITALVFAVAWTIAWFAFIQPLLRKYSFTAAVVERLDAAEGGVWKKIAIWFEAKKTLALAFLTSAFAAGKAATDQATAVASHAVSSVTSLTPDAITPLQDKSMWSAFFNDVWTLHIIAALGLLTAFLTLKGKVTAAQITPAPGTASVPSLGASS